MFEFNPVNRDDIRKIILNTPSNKALGPDKIRVQVHKRFSYRYYQFLIFKDINISINLETGGSDTVAQRR
jgi:hypothetical protein